MYYIKIAKGKKREITRADVLVSGSFPGVDDVEDYLDEIEAGQYGLKDVRVRGNIYWTADPDHGQE